MTAKLMGWHTSEVMGMVRTVLGDIEPDQLGRTYGHEHVFFAPLQNRGDDLRRTESERARRELTRFSMAGGSGLVDATVAELGRDASAVAEVAESTGVHVILACGHTADEWWKGVIDIGARSRDELVAEMTVELTKGIGTSGVRAGVIKIGTSEQDISPIEARMIEAAGIVQRNTGAPITTHTTAGALATRQLASLVEAGVDPSRICIGHLDRNPVWTEHLALARAGAYFGYDQISKEKYAPDTERARLVARLVEEGYGDRIILGGDLARRSDLASWGGTGGLDHILTSFVPLLRSHGLSDADVDRILIENPRRFLAWD